MSNRLNQEREVRLQPHRANIAVQELAKLGKEMVEVDEKRIKFIHNGNTITFWPYSGWASGKGIKDGRGLENLLKQLK